MSTHLRAASILALALLCLAATGCSGPDTDSELLSIREAEDARDLGDGLLFDDLDSGSRPVRAAAARALGRIGDPAAVGPLLDALRGEDNDEVRREIAFALGLLDEPDAVPPLIAALESEDDATTSAEIAIAVGRIGDAAALTALHALSESPWGIIRERLAEALALLADPKSVPVLVRLIDDPDPGVAWRAAYALEKIEDTGQVPALVDAVRTGGPELRRAAVRSLGRLEAAAGVEAILEAHAAHADDWQLEVRVADALGRIGDPRPGVLAAIGELLSAENFHVRTAALQATGRARWLDLLPRVLDLRADPVVDVRAAAFEATADCLDGRTKELLQPGLADASPIVVATCLRRLGEAGDETAVEILLDTLAGASQRGLRLAAAEGLAAAGERADLDHLLTLLGDRDPFVATTAAAALGERGSTEALPALISVLQRPDPASADLRLATVTALGAIGDIAAVDVLRAVLGAEDDPRIRIAARDALEELLTPEQALGLPDPAEIRRDVRPVSRSPRQPATVVRSHAVQLVLHTDRGGIVIDLFGEDAPQMVESFAKLAEDGFFDQLTFHRVVGDFVVQGGDPTGTGWGDAGYTLRSEWNPRRYERGTVGIAHSGKDTGSCQLFITQSPQPHLDARYTIWGEVVEGMDVVDRIQRGDRFSVEVVRRAE